jgi:hypothetical protein
MLVRNAAVGVWVFLVSLLLVACSGAPEGEGDREPEVVGQVSEAVTGPPTVTAFSPATGYHGATVTIFGTQFEPGVSVSFNGTAATSVTYVTGAKVRAVVPVGATTGPISVTNTLGTGTSTTSFGVRPQLLSFAPPSAFPGNLVTLTGAGFTGATAVNFGATPATGFTVVNDATITATVPAGLPSVKISVITPQGTATSMASFITAPAITSFSPTSGGVGTLVTILGGGFNAATQVLFGVGSATFTVVNDTTMTATVPPTATSGKITLVTPSGSRQSALGFAVLEMPVITSIAPLTAVLPATVTIRGDGFFGTSRVSVGALAVPYTVVNNRTITATIPVGAPSGRISVKNPVGTAQSVDRFTPDPDECALNTDNCDPAAICTNTLGGFSCACPGGMTGNGQTCQCNLNGTFAVKAEFDIEWDATVFLGVTVISAGSATTSSWSIRKHTQTGSTIDVDTTGCGGTVPDLCSPFFNQAFAQNFPDAIWDLPSMPVSESTMTLVDPDPGEAFLGPTEVTLLGLSIPTPGGPWPGEWNDVSITWLDHDNDGLLGVTSKMINTGTSTSCGGMPYANLPDPTTPFSATRITDVRVGSRSIGTYDGSLTSCSVIEGEVTGSASGFPEINGHVHSCKLSNGNACSLAQINALDDQAQATGRRTLATRFTMVKVADDVTCGDVREMTFP